MARQSAFAVQQTTSDGIEIRKALSVRYVLQGSARKVGRQDRINVQLVYADTGENTWADRYDRTLDDIFAVKGEIVAKIIEELQINLGAAGKQAAEGFNVDAYELFLKARTRFYEFSAEAFADIYHLTARAWRSTRGSARLGRRRCLPIKVDARSFSKGTTMGIVERWRWVGKASRFLRSQLSAMDVMRRSCF